MRKYFLPLVVLCLLNSALSAQGEWRQLLPTIDWDANGGLQIWCMATDPAGNVYFCGYSGSSNIYKWDGNNYSILGPNYGVTNIAADKSGNIYASCLGQVQKWNGSAWSQIGNFNIVAGQYANVLVTTDANGNLYAAVNYSGLNYYVASWNGVTWTTSDTIVLYNGYPSALCADIYGNIYLAGNFTRTPSSSELYIAMWNGSEWTEPGAGYDTLSSNAVFYALYADAQGNIYAAGCGGLSAQNLGSATFSVGKWDGNSWSALGGEFMQDCVLGICGDDSGYLYATAGGGSGVQKWDGSQWNTLPGRIPSNFKGDVSISVCADHDGHIFVGGNFTDFNNNPYVAEYINLPEANMYVYLNASESNCSSPGTITTDVHGGIPPYTYVWSNNDTTASLQSLIGGNYSVTITDSVGRQITASVSIDTNCYSVITGTVFKDINSNCIFDSTDQPESNFIVQVVSANGKSYYGYTNTKGQYSISIPDSGLCTIFLSSSQCVYASLCGYGNDTLTIPHYGDTLSNVNFAVTGSTFDLTLHPGWTSANPGFTKEYWIMPYNTSPFPDTGQVTIVFTYDSNLIYQSSLPPMPLVNTVAHTLTYVLDGSSIPYPYFDWNNERFISYFMVPSNLSLNYNLQSDFLIEPLAGDCNPANNHLHFSDPVTGSHDPNSKSVSPSGFVSDGDSVFTYTINFQNTGTDSTNFVVVKDTLSPYLNPASVDILASSDNYTSFAISGTGILTWTFNPLRLPYQSIDSVNSKGFIIFSVKLRDGLSAITPVANSATVYFDYNPGIQTNTASDTVCTPVLTTLSATICHGQTYSFNNVEFDTTGVYSDTTIMYGGCDSITTLNLTVLSAVSSTLLSDTICANETFSFNGHNLDSTGIYTDTLQGFTVCDSVVTLQLTVLPIDSISFTSSICTGSTYSFFGTDESSAGSYSHTLQNVNGCDSVVTLQLSLLPVDSTSFTDTICTGDTFPFFGANLLTSGPYSHTLQNINGCDSIVTLQLTVLPPDSGTYYATICTGDTFPFYGTSELSSGTYSYTTQNIKGCDSVVILYLTVLPPDSSSLNGAICSGDTFPFFGANETTGGDYSATMQNQNGCYSVVTLHLTVYPPTTPPVLSPPDTGICPGDSVIISSSGYYSAYRWNTGANTPGIYADSTGSYSVQVTDSNGCKAMSDTMNLLLYTVQPITIFEVGDTLSSLPGRAYQWYLNYTPIPGADSGIYIPCLYGDYALLFTDSNGCSSLSIAVTPLYFNSAEPGCYTGLPQLDENTLLNIYPNPSTGTWQLEAGGDLMGARMSVYDEQGRLIFNSELKTPNSKLDLNVPSGVYYLRISNENVSVVRKLVKM